MDGRDTTFTPGGKGKLFYHYFIRLQMPPWDPQLRRERRVLPQWSIGTQEIKTADRHPLLSGKEDWENMQGACTDSPRNNN